MKLIIIFLLILSFACYSQDFWERTNGVFNYHVQCLTINSNGDIFAGTDGGGIFRSTDNGNSWTAINNGVSWLKISSLDFNLDGDIFAGAFSKDLIFRSTDNGDNWTEVSNGLEYIVNCLAINQDGEIFAGTGIEFSPPGGGVYRSSNNGESWAQINIGLSYLFIKSLAINSNGDIFAGTTSGGMFRSVDNGENWTKIHEELSTEYNSIIIDSTGGNIFAGTKKGVFYSSDNGDNWTRISDGITQIEISCLLSNSSGDIFAGIMNRMSSVSGKVYRLFANNEIWIEVSEGLSYSGVINSLAINAYGHIFAGSNSLGVFRSINSTVIVEGKNILPFKYNLEQNYPNPFNPNTTINYSIPSVISNPSYASGEISHEISPFGRNDNPHVTLKVYDILGREVATLVNKQQKPSYYEITWNASNQSSGIYFYRIEAHDFVETKKMVLLR